MATTLGVVRREVSTRLVLPGSTMKGTLGNASIVRHDQVGFSN